MRGAMRCSRHRQEPQASNGIGAVDDRFLGPVEVLISLVEAGGVTPRARMRVETDLDDLFAASRPGSPCNLHDFTMAPRVALW